jgi:hypothetical protein
VAPQPVVIETPVPSPGPWVLDRDEHFARKAVIAHTGYRAFDAAFVAGRRTLAASM